jgi:signal transduction histidine kinase
VEDLDDTVKHIRTVIFGLETSRILGGGLRDQVLALAREAAGPLGFSPRVVFEGPVDTLVDDTTGTELLATLREALSNVARHAHAHQVDVEVAAGDDVELRVRDDGRGIGEDPVGSGYGLRNMADRAESLGGCFRVEPANGGGTLLEWRVPSKGGKT